MMKVVGWLIAHLTLVSGIVGALAGIGVAVGAYLQQQEQAKKSRQLLGQVTGADSFVYLEPLRQKTAVRYFVRQAGDYPTYDVVVRIQEIVVIDGKRKRQLCFGPADAG